jgi:RHS repeat-associated protein
MIMKTLSNLPIQTTGPTTMFKQLHNVMRRTAYRAGLALLFAAASSWSSAQVLFNTDFNSGVPAEIQNRAGGTWANLSNAPNGLGYEFNPGTDPAVVPTLVGLTRLVSSASSSWQTYNTQVEARFTNTTNANSYAGITARMSSDGLNYLQLIVRWDASATPPGWVWSMSKVVNGAGTRIDFGAVSFNGTDNLKLGFEINGNNVMPKLGIGSAPMANLRATPWPADSNVPTQGSIGLVGRGGKVMFDNWSASTPVTLSNAVVSCTPTSGTAPLTISCNGTVSGGAATWSWLANLTGVGVGANISTTLQAGTYTVRGTAVSLDGLSSATNAVAVTVSPSTTVTPPSNVTLSCTPTQGTANLQVSCNASASGTGISWSWTSNGTVVGSNSASYSVLLPAGNYSIVARATNGGGGVDSPAVPINVSNPIPSGTTNSYSYDERGNRTLATGTNPVGYDGEDRPNGGNLDANGNNLGVNNVYSYDAADRLIGSTNGISYQYDALGNLVRIIQNGQATELVWDERGELPQLMAEVRQNGSKTLYVYGPEGLHARQDISAAGGGSTPTAQYTALAEQNFDSGATSNLTTSGVGAWTTVADGGSQVYRHADPGVGYAVFNTPGSSTWVNYDAETNIRFASYPVNTYGGLQVRIDGSNASSHFYLILKNESGTGQIWSLVKQINGASVRRDSGSFTVDPNTTYKMRIEVNGNQIVAKLGPANGALTTLASWTETDLAQGSVGIRARDGDVRFDNLKVGYTQIVNVPNPGTSTTVVSYPLTDDQGTVSQWLRGDGSAVQTISYDPWGNISGTTGSNPSGMTGAVVGPGYTGELQLPDGNVYLRSRIYNPSSGRFLQRDSFAGYIDRPQSLNRFAYVEGNVATWTDPSGFSPTGFGASKIGNDNSDAKDCDENKNDSPQGLPGWPGLDVSPVKIAGTTGAAGGKPPAAPTAKPQSWQDKIWNGVRGIFGGNKPTDTKPAVPVSKTSASTGNGGPTASTECGAGLYPIGDSAVGGAGSAGGSAPMGPLKPTLLARGGGGKAVAGGCRPISSANGKYPSSGTISPNSPGVPQKVRDRCQAGCLLTKGVENNPFSKSGVIWRGTSATRPDGSYFVDDNGEVTIY